nr:MICOS complex subunit MIC27 isoform X4 [Cavia porcellus]
MAPFRIGKLTRMPMGVIYASVSVHLAKEEESKKQLVRPEQLPIYTVPPLQSKYVEEHPGYLQMGFASIRTTTSCYIGWCKSTYVLVKNGIMDTVQFGKDTYVYLKNPPRDFLPKLGVITISGLVGLVSARKGPRFKKIAYPLGLATVGATVCYPVQSVIIAKVLPHLCLTLNSWIMGSLVQKMKTCTALEAKVDCIKNYNMCEVASDDEKFVQWVTDIHCII